MAEKTNAQKRETMRGMTNEELTQNINDAHQELFNLRFQLATRKLKNHGRILEVRRDIARMKTILRESELMAQHASSLDENS